MKKDQKDYQYQVEKFIYNGLFVNTKPGLTKYKANFNSWTTDPGVLLADCSDGKQREIPSCCLINFKSSDYPEQKKSGIILGKPSKS